MLTTHKISAELYFDTFELLAIHAALEDYTIAYTLNKYLKLNLSRCKRDIRLSNLASFSLFEWMDKLSETNWILFKNQSDKEQEGLLGGLFDNDKTTTINYLVSERKEVDYFLKIQSDESSIINDIVNEVNKIPDVLTAYAIDVEKLRSRKNLIT
jgi:hypothetical protein